MKKFTPKDLQELITKTEDELRDKYERVKKMYKNGERNLKNFENVTFFFYNNIISKDIKGMSIDDAVEILEGIQKTYKEMLQENKYISLGIHNRSYHDDCGDWGCIFKIEWYELREPTDSKIQNEVKSKLVNYIQTNYPNTTNKNGIKYSIRNVDCKLLSLFKEGKIDFDTFVELTSNGCKV